MNSNPSKATVLGCIEKALGLPLGSLGETSKSTEINNWDSLGQVDIIMALDILFGGKVTMIPEMADANSVADILDILKRHLLLI